MRNDEANGDGVVASLLAQDYPAFDMTLIDDRSTDAHTRFSREYGLSPLWLLTAPAGWAAFGVLLLDTVRLALTGRGADWKGRTAPRDDGGGPRRADQPPGM